MISVITIAKNEEKTIERTILSVTNQSAINEIEYIVIDGKSSDNTLEIIKKYKNKISKIISEADFGIYNAMNKGIKAAKGEYILFLNAGDELFCNKTIEEILPKLNCGVVFADVSVRDEKGQKGTIDYDYLDDFELFYKSLPHMSTFIKKELFLKFGLYDETKKIVSDWQWFLKYFNSKGKYKYIKTPVAIFYLGGISTKKETKNLREKERAKVRNVYDGRKKQVLYKISVKLTKNKALVKLIRKILSSIGIVKIYENCSKP